MSAKLLLDTSPKSQWHVRWLSKSKWCCRAGALWTEPSVHPSTIYCQLPDSRSWHCDSFTSVLQFTNICLEGYIGAGWCQPSGHCGPSQLSATSQPFIWHGMSCKVQHSSSQIYKGEHLHPSSRVKLIEWLAAAGASVESLCADIAFFRSDSGAGDNKLFVLFCSSCPSCPSAQVALLSARQSRYRVSS